MNKAYDKITWQNTPSTATPLGATNLNKMSDALDTIDDRVITLDSGKVDKETGKGLSTNDYTTAEKTKLEGISANAKNVSISGTLESGDTIANITIDGTTTPIKSTQITVDSQLSTESENPVQNKVIYEALNNILPEETAEGNPISITDASGLNAKSCEVTMNPIQDLHGQSAPYPAGGGKNKLPMTVANIKAENTGGTWSGNVYSLFGVDFTVQTDSDENVIGIKAYGTPTRHINFILKTNLNILNTDLILNGTPSGLSGISALYAQTTHTHYDNGSGVSFNSGSGIVKIVIVVNSGKTIDVVYNPMIRLSTVTDATFAPYSNICPISGRDSANVGVTGKNLIIGKIAGASNNSSGEIVSSNNADIYIARVSSGTSYCISINGTLTSSYYGIYSEYPAIGSVSITGRNYNSKLTPTVDGYIAFRMSNEVTQAQIELGQTATEYEPYNGETYTATFSDTVYGGKWLPQEGKAVIEWVAVDMGSIDYTSSDAGLFRYRPTNGIISGDVGSNANDFMCSIYANQSDKVIGSQNVQDLKCAKTSSTIYCSYYFRDDNYSTIEAFKTAMSGQTFCYKLATPTEITLTPEDIELLKGNNTLWTDGDSVKLVYSADIKAYIDSQLNS